MSISYIDTKKREDFPEFEELFKLVESFMGYLPNSYLLMADKPELLEAFAKMSAAVFNSVSLDAHGAERAGVANDKIADILNYQNSEHYDAKEVALLDLAFASGEVPNGATKTHFDNLKKYYSKQQIIDMVSVISFFGFLNRWNDTFGTEIEAVPAQYIDEVLKPKNW